MPQNNVGAMARQLREELPKDPDYSVSNLAARLAEKMGGAKSGTERAALRERILLEFTHELAREVLTRKAITGNVHKDIVGEVVHEAGIHRGIEVVDWIGRVSGALAVASRPITPQISHQSPPAHMLPDELDALRVIRERHGDPDDDTDDVADVA